LDDIERAILTEWYADERTTWVEGRSYSNLVCEAGRGSCPSANSYIVTSKGTITYGELHEYLSKGEKVGIHTLDSDYKPKITFNIKTWDEGLKPAIKITTKSGYQEICTRNHPYLTQDNKWMNIEELKLGDELYIQTDIPLYGQEEIGLNKSALLAHAISNDSPTFQLFNNLQVHNEDLRDLLDWLEDITDVSNPISIIQKAPLSDLSTFLKTIFTIKSYIVKINNQYIVKLDHLDLDILRAIKTELIKFGVLSYIEVNLTGFSSQYNLQVKDNNSLFNLLTFIGVNKYKEEIKELIDEITPYAGNHPYLISDYIIGLKEIELEPIIGIEVSDTEIIGNTIISHNSKSTLASIIALYELYTLISLENPARHYNLLANDPIAIFVIATTQAQVKETLYAKIKGFAEQSNYFKTLVNSGHIQIQAESIKCPSKNVAIYAKHTNSPALVGYTLKALILDEVARFDNRVEPDGTITSTADEIWDNIGVAVKRFGKQGKRIAISSAWSVNDPIERFLNLTQADKDSLGFKLRTWDLNKRKESNRESCNSDYIKDRAKAELEYEGVRTKGIGKFISQEALDQCTKGKSIIDTTEMDKDEDVGGDIRHYVTINIDRLEKPLFDFTYFIHVDFSIKRDATALCISHPVVTENEDGIPIWYIAVDGLLKWSPYLDSVGRRRTVSYTNIEDVLVDICEDRSIGKITFDSFNSISTIQRLHRLGLRTEEVSASRKNQLDYYTTTRDLISQTLVHIPTDSIYTSQLHSELTNLVLKANGSIKHGYIGKDLSDAFVNSVYQSYLHLITSGATNLKDNQSLINVNPSNNLTKGIKTNPSTLSQRILGNKVDRVLNLRKRGII
jgi:intein/homing endonuclease